MREALAGLVGKRLVFHMTVETKREEHSIVVDVMCDGECVADHMWVTLPEDAPAAGSVWVLATVATYAHRVPRAGTRLGFTPDEDYTLVNITVLDEHQARVEMLYQNIITYMVKHSGRSPTLRELRSASVVPVSIDTVRSDLRELARRGIIVLGHGRPRHISIPGSTWLPPGEYYGRTRAKRSTQ